MGQKPRLTKCLLFDRDGTLVDIERLCDVGLVVTFKELGCDLDANELTSRFRGWKLANILELLQQESLLALSDNFPHIIGEKWLSYYRAS